MLFKILAKNEFQNLMDLFLESNEVVAPKQIGTNAKGKKIHQFLPVKSFQEMDLENKMVDFSAKTYFLPFKENLSTFNFSEKDWEQEIRYRIQPRVLLGLHACDINALLKLDKVFLKGKFPSPYYISRRKNTFVIGLDEKEPCQNSFCHSLGTDIVTHGFDLFLTDLGDRYFVSINSDRAFGMLGKVKTKDCTDQDTKDYLAVRKEFESKLPADLEVKNLPNLMDIEFDSEVWKSWGKKCLSCGSCAMVCPTCYCYGICERISMDFKEGAKVKQLYSCNLLDFSMVAGKHNFRPDKQSRLKYRFYHQHRGFVESFDEPKCVGCNRCGRVCLSGINPPDIIRDLHLEASQ